MEGKFPDGFLWGTATASYQIEGAYKQDGKKLNIWDTFSRKEGKVVNGDTGEDACDHYNRMEEDVALMAELGVPWYRFSISWARIVPSGLAGSEINQKGLDFYNRLIDRLLASNIQPLVTLYHWDLPQELEDETGGFLNKDFYKHFHYYADVCFNAFGDRVKQWLTFNEPWCICALGYAFGVHAPGRTEKAGEEPYIAGHNLIIAHAHAYHLYVNKYKQAQGGVCAITLNTDWFEPVKFEWESEERYKENCRLAQRGLAYILDWFAEPIFGSGDYPEQLKEVFRERQSLREVLKFSEEEKALVKGSSDFFGLNHYTTHFVYKKKGFVEKLLFTRSFQEVQELFKRVLLPPKESYQHDMGVPAYPFFHKVLGAPDSDREELGATDMNWRIVPFGLRKLLLYIHNKYHPRGGTIITENGLANKEISREDALSEETGKRRIDYFRRYLTEVLNAIKEGADVRGYVAWSFMDNFEWAFGYEKRFGMVYVDYETKERTPKPVFHWYKKLVASNQIPPLE